MKKTDPEVIELTQRIQALQPGQTDTVTFSRPVAFKVRNHVRKDLTRKEIGDNIVMSMVSPSCLMIHRKQKSYTQKLEDVLRKVMLAVDNENLYDEALMVLEEKNG